MKINLDPKDVSSVYAVKPKLDNPRIAKQHGAFLIFGISPSLFTVFGLYKPMAKFNKKWIERGSDSDQRIIIDKNLKLKYYNNWKALVSTKLLYFQKSI